MTATPLFDLTDDQLRSRASVKWGTVGSEVIPAWVAEMDVKIAPAITERLQQALDAHDTGYPGEVAGLQSAFARFAADRWKWSPRPEDVTVHVDVASACATVMSHLAGSDRGVVIMPPVYNNFYTWVEHAGLHPVEVPLLDVATGGQMDLQGVRRALEDGTRIILLCSPQNPLGRVYTGEELAALAELAAEHHATVISDEIHAPLVHSGVEFVPYLTVSDAARTTGIAVHSASKSWNIAGLKCGLLVRSPQGPWPEQVDPAITQTEAGHWGVLAAEAAFQDGTEWLDEAVQHFEDQSQHLVALLEKHLPGVRCLPPQASFLAWLDFSPLGLEDPAQFFLDHAQVMLSPGEIFDPSCRGRVRLNMGTSRERLERIIAAMGTAWADHRN
ncbi:aminotransferase class I/II-fold pyridoxal phosphate-dependent enzyme [Micrococcus terreus]|uniref:MalY/PatB family protein n=1 Tax=Micrococcus terreus TaxID=574650 RepID=UPI0021A94B5E|nr:aminotransferase class I/II-fold pyridoxal phosphate-dependent enzyme [Micrococcus terreus]MCT2088390.1 aminotransferase class I/II-fold pyridoxal phosphate-dependent enzyme [Micrococcus terreus]